MSADERIPGQHGFGEQSPQGQSKQQPMEHRQQENPTDQNDSLSQGGSMSTGQASYGNSGEGAIETLSQNSSSLGQESDLGQSGQGRDTGLFSGSETDMGIASAGTGRSGIEGSMDESDQSTSEPGASTGRSGIEGSLDSTSQSGSRQPTDGQALSDQDFAGQGQGALNEDTKGSDRETGTVDIEMERSQGRESDIEGSSL